MQLFLGEAIVGYRGPERPSDVLAAADFFPVLHADDTVHLVNRASVVALTTAMEVELAAGELSVEDLAGENATSRNVQVFLRNGPPLGGTVVYVLPDGQRRLLDFLNLPDAFIPLRDGEKVHLIRKAFVTEIVER